MATYAPAFEQFVRPARIKPQIWRLIVGMVLSTIIYVIWVAVLFGGAYATIGFGSFEQWAGDLVQPDTVRPMLLLLASFGGMMLGPMLVARWIHKRPMGSVFGPAAITLRHFCYAAMVAGVLLFLSVGFWFLMFDAERNLATDVWFTVLPFAIVGLLVQTGAEEVLFRGYMQQQLAARFRSPLIWMVLPSVLFGLVHMDPSQDTRTVVLVVGAATVFGLLAADLTAVTGSIGAAWGFHFANNAIAILVISTKGSLTGLSLYLTPYGLDEAMQLTGPLIQDLLIMFVIWIILRRTLAR